jgi:hypothetical protein
MYTYTHNTQDDGVRKKKVVYALPWNAFVHIGSDLYGSGKLELFSLQSVRGTPSRTTEYGVGRHYFAFRFRLPEWLPPSLPLSSSASVSFCLSPEIALRSSHGEDEVLGGKTVPFFVLSPQHGIPKGVTEAVHKEVNGSSNHIRFTGHVNKDVFLHDETCTFRLKVC